MTPYGQTPVDLKRGAAIKDEYGNVITKGKQLLAQTGTDRNFGMNKGIYRHELDKADMQQLPYMIRDYAPAEVTPRGQKIYRVPYGNKEQPLVAALTPEDNRFGVASMYRNMINPNVGLSQIKHSSQSQQKAYQALADGYTAGDFDFIPTGESYRSNLSPYGGVVNGADGIANMALTPEDNKFGVASVYRRDSNINSVLSPFKGSSQFPKRTYPATTKGYTTGDFDFIPTGESYKNSLSPYGGVVNGIEDYSQRQLTEEELDELRKRYGYGWF